MKSRPKKKLSLKDRLPIGFQLEKQFGKNGIVVGLDEVGRGCVAGPVCVAIVAFDAADRESPPEWMSEVVDSKLISEKKRESLSSLIKAHALYCDFQFVEAAEVDRINILQASLMGFRRLLTKAQSTQKLEAALIDGPYEVSGVDLFQKAVIKGDRVSRSIAAASIIAKVERDNLMRALSEKFPQYDWASNKGYGTKKHWEALEKTGPCLHHRKTFLKKLRAQAAGRRAEDEAAIFLEAKGFEIIDRNWRSKEAEIDIVARKDKELHFVEVRFRRDANAELSFSVKKREAVKQAAKIYLSQCPEFYDEIQFDFLLTDNNEVTSFWNEKI